VPGAAAIITDFVMAGVGASVIIGRLAAITGTPQAVMVAHSLCDIGCEQGAW